MVAPLAKYNRYSRRRRRRAERAHQRLDIQGLRMMAVLTVFANHLWDFPRGGGFVGVDVFFVISGFLITSNLLRAAEKNMQSASAKLFFWTFYWNRIRRIVPAATVVLLLTYLVGTVAFFLPFRAQEIGVDALWAFAFLSTGGSPSKAPTTSEPRPTPCRRCNTTGRCRSRNNFFTLYGQQLSS